MTIRELYEWACRNDGLDCKIRLDCIISKAEQDDYADWRSYRPVDYVFEGEDVVLYQEGVKI